ncbi:GntR family transcriptional regulator [Thermomonospora catenispora]|uniref:GntR family transcriptional regulator n=1 Tax=Thermomonospora catenispora TaxID=2493090 RepID=UPI00111F2108|nr:GntR family transcriptional regulator [Thermomonospora catenispora]TNY37304.1 GntR family transcriptional regulator [Thermomonospora catenispora]
MPELEQALPKYLQIAGHIRDRILRGDLQPGDEVPSERQIAAEWNVSRPTATKALEALRLQGLVESRRGSGTYVRNRYDLHRRARERYQRASETGRIYPPNERAEIVAAELVPAPPHVAEALGLENGQQAVRRHRIIYRDDHPVEASTSWYPAAIAERAPRLLEHERILEGTLAYVESATGRRARHAYDRVAARLAGGEELAVFGLAAPAAVLVIRHVVLDVDERPLEFAEAVYPPDAWTYEQRYTIH